MLCNINLTLEYSLKALQNVTDQVPLASAFPSGVQGFDFSCQLWAPGKVWPLQMMVVQCGAAARSAWVKRVASAIWGMPSVTPYWEDDCDSSEMPVGLSGSWGHTQIPTALPGTERTNHEAHEANPTLVFRRRREEGPSSYFPHCCYRGRFCHLAGEGSPAREWECL